MNEHKPMQYLSSAHTNAVILQPPFNGVVTRNQWTKALLSTYYELGNDPIIQAWLSIDSVVTDMVDEE